MRILVSGSTGLVGRALSRELEKAGHRVGRLVRTSAPQNAGDVRWNPETGELDAASAEGADAVVHLAGASIGEARWTPERKAVLRSSRVEATRHLVAGLAKLTQRPRTFICASAIGYYGNRGDEILTESSAPGTDFLAKLCQDWEAAAREAENCGMRAVILRFGVILAKEGGALPRMLPPFRLGVGGRLGNGQQWMSWVTITDVVRIIQYALQSMEIMGAVNVVSPNPARNSEFTSMLSHTLRRPAIFPVPGFALRLALGEMADALLLSSQRVLPEKLSRAGYSFGQTTLEVGLSSILG
jgi:uncharacterized protein